MMQTIWMKIHRKTMKEANEIAAAQVFLIIFFSLYKYAEQFQIRCYFLVPLPKYSCVKNNRNFFNVNAF